VTLQRVHADVAVVDQVGVDDEDLVGVDVAGPHHGGVAGQARADR
jgi:hypothetical protein